jgi:hypothetical protein
MVTAAALAPDPERDPAAGSNAAKQGLLATGGHYSVLSVLRDRALRTAFEFFVMLQFLDVASSAAGQANGLHEGNPLTLAVVRVWGTPGFVISKLPVVIVVLLAIARLPRRLGLFVGWGLTAASAPVVAWNIHLLLQGSGSWFPGLR